jgi:DNA polymerase III sliding clamp (beta) subunit (PCNA family)
VWLAFFINNINNRKDSMKTNIEIPIADLKTVLPGLTKITPKRNGLPVLGCVKLTLNQDRTLHIQANNLEQIVTARLNKPFNGKPGQMLVPLDELSSMAKRCAATDIIELSVNGKETAITYPAAGTRIKKPISYLALDEFPPETVVNAEPIKLDDAFKLALKQAFTCASEDSSRYVLQGACLDVSNKEAHYVVATDARHIFSANSFLFDVPASIILPPGKFLTWDGFVEDGPWTLRYQPEVKGETQNAHKPAWVRLDSDHWTFVSKPIEGQYPNWKQVVPPTEALKSHIILGEPGINMILEALPLLPGNEDLNQPVTLEVKGEYLTLKAKGKGDWTEIPIPAKVSGLPVTISMNRKYLTKALKFGFTQVDIEDKTSPVVFSTKGKMLVISPLGPPDANQVADAPTSPPDNPSATALPAATAPSVEQPASQSTSEPQTEERTDMPRTARTTTPESASRPGLTTEAQTSSNGTTINGNGTSPAVKSLVDQVESIKDTLRGAIRDLSTVVDTVKQGEKEKRATEKEIEAVRTKLRQIQNVSI